MWRSRNLYLCFPGMAGKRCYFTCCFLLQPCSYSLWTMRVEEHSSCSSIPQRLQERVGGISPKWKRAQGLFLQCCGLLVACLTLDLEAAFKSPWSLNSLLWVSNVHGGAFLKKMQCLTDKALPASTVRVRGGSLCGTRMVIRPHVFRSHSLLWLSSRYLMVQSRMCVLYTEIKHALCGGVCWKEYFSTILIKDPVLESLEVG